MHYDVEPPEPRRTGHQWVDFIIAGSALMISLISLFVAIRHGEVMEQMAHANARLVEANSWPFIGTHLSRDDDVVELGIRNSGVGPAKIRWLELRYDGAVVRTTPELLTRCCGYRPSDPVDYAYSLATNTVVRAGEEVDVVTLRREPANARVFDPLGRNLLRVGFRICYCSVFDECFIGDGLSLNTRAVERCVASPDAFQEMPARAAADAAPVVGATGRSHIAAHGSTSP